MRVAIVAPHPLLPATTGDRVRIAQLVPALGRLGVDVRLLWAAYDPKDEYEEGAIRARPGSSLGRLCWRAWLAGARLGDPFAIHRWPGRRRRLSAAIDRLQPDVVDFQHSFCWFPVRYPSVLTAIDVQAHRFEREGRVGRATLARVRAMERAAIAGSDVTVALSDLDGMRLSALRVEGAHITVVPIGLDPARDPMELRARARTAAFVGSFGYEPNVQAARALVERWPAIRHAGGFERLVVIGSGARGHVREEATILVRSDVLDVPAALADADVLVVPLLNGGGVRVKIIEAMALGLPVVSTAVGIEGLGAVDGVHAAVAAGIDDLPAACARVRPLGVRQAMASAARQLWEAYFSPARMAEGMLAAYERARSAHSRIVPFTQ